MDTPISAPSILEETMKRKRGERREWE